jgi:hypothetical protein
MWINISSLKPGINPVEEATKEKISRTLNSKISTRGKMEKKICRMIYDGRYWDRTSDLFGVNEALSP